MLTFLKKNYNPKNFLKSTKVIYVNPMLNRHHLRLRSHFLDRKVKVDIYLSSDVINWKSTLLLNDGQDMEQLKIEETLTALFSEEEFMKIAVVAIHANKDRMQEYGVANFPDYNNRGSKAGRYANFIIKELVPFLQKEYGLMKEENIKAFAGFSMGGLSAFDISWSNPELFNKVGIFSASLWWRSLNTGTAKDDEYRIMHRRIRESVKREGLKFWFQTGTNDESSDRNKNGVIDSIDDTLDMIKEMKTLGYTDQDIEYIEVENGEHNFQTWSEIFPDFLRWTFSIR
ncbi:MAG TPA: alpha/beta hydrolase-fold protein [Anditalea sp.]|nr:alpha/beta hydrolase-fold protein [Anditalea sp.]